MKPEREIVWAAVLYSSNHVKDVLNFRKGNPTTKKEFERLLRCGENNYRFNQWFLKLIEENVIEPIDGKYILNASKMQSYLFKDDNTKELFFKIYKFCKRDTTL